MNFPVLLAHGALGNWDEMIFLGVVVIFVILMGISWVRSRANAESPENAIQTPASKTDDPTSSEQFKLE